MSKYYSKKIEIDGHKFDSVKEGSRYIELRLLEVSGKISNLTLQPSFTLLKAFKYKGKTVRGITYKGDFMYVEGGKTVVEDVKGFKTEVYKIKRKLFLSQYPHIDFREI